MGAVRAAGHRAAGHRAASHRATGHRAASHGPPATGPPAVAPFAAAPPAASVPLSLALVIAFQAASAACCSASFFDRPDPDPYVRPPTRTEARKNFWWSGPLSST